MPRLLLIDDHAELADTTAEFLRGAGLDVRHVSNGNEALASAGAYQPNIVLCDLNLPDMSGFEVARRMRENPVTKSALFAIHTALSETDIWTFERFVPESDVNLYLPKPMTIEKLDRLLEAFNSRLQPVVRSENTPKD